MIKLAQTDYNRLIAHTDNFFVISGYGAFDVGCIY